MLPVRLTLMRAGDGKPADDGETRTLEDVLWAHATPEHGMEHIRARVIPPGIGIILFIRAATADAAQSKAQRLVADVLASAGTGAHGYSVTFHR